MCVCVCVCTGDLFAVSSLPEMAAEAVLMVSPFVGTVEWFGGCLEVPAPNKLCVMMQQNALSVRQSNIRGKQSE